MEPILVILLLFGAFTLGAETADTRTVETMAPVSEQQPQGTEKRAVTSSLKSCLSERRSTIYRDLIVPFTRQQTALSAPLDSECPDE